MYAQYESSSITHYRFEKKLPKASTRIPQTRCQNGWATMKGVISFAIERPMVQIQPQKTDNLRDAVQGEGTLGGAGPGKI